MIKSKNYYIITLILGIVLLSITFLLGKGELKAVGGVLLGIGAGLIGMSISNLIMCNIQQKNPNIKKQNEIEYNDERNTAIRNRAKAKSADITQWFIMGVAYITILIKAALWVTLITIGVFLVYHLLNTFYMIKYQNEM